MAENLDFESESFNLVEEEESSQNEGLEVRSTNEWKVACCGRSVRGGAGCCFPGKLE
jgi:hypothetical protein